MPHVLCGMRCITPKLKAMEKTTTNTITTFFTEKQVCFDSIREQSFSQSPLKPYLLMLRLNDLGLSDYFDIRDDFKPFEKSDFEMAHTRSYIDNVFNKTGNYASNGLPWSENLVESLTYTNSALYHAMRHAYLNPTELCFAPVSGMHHAMPNSGCGFCTFSGQVIASVKLYEEFGAVGAWLDLDGHFGNSIEDTRSFNPIVDKAIPRDCNINPSGKNDHYVAHFKEQLAIVGEKIKKNKVHYVVFAHGADSHLDDDLGGYCDTEHWVECAQVFSDWVNKISLSIGRPLPVTMALFGGYRKSNYKAVLDLHIDSLATCLLNIDKRPVSRS